MKSWPNTKKGRRARKRVIQGGISNPWWNLKDRVLRLYQHPKKAVMTDLFWDHPNDLFPKHA